MTITNQNDSFPPNLTMPFGVVLYEMLTGKRLFEGETTMEILSAVLTKEPEWDRVPSQIGRLLRRCLEKDPRQRLRDIGDARFLLDEAPVKATAAPRRILPWALAAILALIVVVALWTLWRSTRPVEQPLVRLDVDLGPDVSLAAPDNYGSGVIISPDGTRLVYKASVSGGPPKLFTRRLDQPKATELSGTEGAVGALLLAGRAVGGVRRRQQSQQGLSGRWRGDPAE